MAWKRKQKSKSLWPITTGTNNTIDRRNSKQRQARRNTCKQIGFVFTSNWLRKWCESSVFFCLNQSPSVFVLKQNQTKRKLLSRLNFKLLYVAELARNRKELSGWALNSLKFWWTYTCISTQFTREFISFIYVLGKIFTNDETKPVLCWVRIIPRCHVWPTNLAACLRKWHAKRLKTFSLTRVLHSFLQLVFNKQKVE